MLITVSISNKTYWVSTWKMLTDYCKKSLCSKTKMAKTNPDGTVSAEIDYDLISALMEEIKHHNLRHEGRNMLTILVDGDSAHSHMDKARA